MQMMMEITMMVMMMVKMMKTQRQSLRVKVAKIQMHLVVEVYQENQEEEVVEMMDHHLIWGLEMWDLEEEGGIEVREDEEGGQVQGVYWVYKDHKDLRALRV